MIPPLVPYIPYDSATVQLSPRHAASQPPHTACTAPPTPQAAPRGSCTRATAAAPARACTTMMSARPSAQPLSTTGPPEHQGIEALHSLRVELLVSLSDATFMFSWLDCNPWNGFSATHTQESRVRCRWIADRATGTKLRAAAARPSGPGTLPPWCACAWWCGGAGSRCLRVGGVRAGVCVCVCVVTD